MKSKKEKEFDLSKKFPYDDMEDSEQWIKIEDVKEFIRLVKELPTKKVFDTATTKGRNIFYNYIDELAGNKLI